MRLAFAVVLLGSTASADSRCKPEPLKLPVASTKPVACHKPGTAREKVLAPLIAKDFQPEHDKGTAEVKFSCDGLGAQITEIVVETGSGHGGTLSMWRAKLRPDGAFDVRGLHHKGASLGSRDTMDVGVMAGVVRLPDLDTARAATSSTIREVFPPPPPDTIGASSFGMSSNDFHLLIRFTDADGRVLERQYTGYESTGQQGAYLGLRVAEDALAPITALTPSEPAIGAVDRALFAERFTAATAHFDDEFYWWVKESFVEMANSVGSRATIPGLVSRLHVTDANDRSQIDTRKNALAALAAITGWDPKGKTDEQTAQRFVDACK